MKFFENVAAKAVGIAQNTAFKVKKASPELLMFAGGAAIVGGVIVACKSTVKALDIIENYDKTMSAIEQATEESEKLNYTNEQRKKDIITVHVQTGIKLGKVYAPAAGLVVGGLVCMGLSHGIMKKRHIEAVAAYKALDKAFKAYRKRVAEKYGEEEEEAVYYNYERKDIKGVEGIPDEKNAKVFDGSAANLNEYSVYSRFFDETSSLYSRDPVTNKTTIIMVEKWANNVLNSRGYLFLNEVYRELGFEDTPEGQLVGWLKGNGDDYVDFKVNNAYRKANREFVNGLEPVVLLDFNVDGVIYDKI